MNQIHLKDCREILTEMKDNSVDLICTDPPYGISYRSNRQTVDRKTSVKDNVSKVVREHYFESIEEDKSFLVDWISKSYRVLKDNSAMYVFAHWSKWPELYNAVDDVGFRVKSMIVLNKSNHGMGDTSSYAPKHELLLFAVKGKHKITFQNGRMNDVWDVPVKFSGSYKLHPNEKPISWIIPIIRNSSKEGDVVLDPFMGSGTVGVVALEMGRSFIGVEKDAKYFEIAKKRLEDVRPKIM